MSNKEAVWSAMVEALGMNTKSYIVVAAENDGHALRAADGNTMELLSLISMFLIEMSMHGNIPLEELLDILRDGTVTAYGNYKADCEKLDLNELN